MIQNSSLKVIFGFKSGICLLIAPVPVHCFSITFIEDSVEMLNLSES